MTVDKDKIAAALGAERVGPMKVSSGWPGALQAAEQFMTQQRGNAMIDKNLLWLAYPKGYLGMSGVRTIGAYIGYGPWYDKANDRTRLVFRKPERGACYIDPEESVDKVRAIAEMVGDGPDELLPAVDPDDPATWACCLRDLALACWENNGPEPFGRWWVSSWHRCMVSAHEKPKYNDPDQWEPGWSLDISWGEMGLITMRFGFFLRDIEDPALALVLSRIALRDGSVAVPIKLRKKEKGT